MATLLSDLASESKGNDNVCVDMRAFTVESIRIIFTAVATLVVGLPTLDRVSETKQEEIIGLEQHPEDLQAEAKSVEARVVELKGAG